MRLLMKAGLSWRSSRLWAKVHRSPLLHWEISLAKKEQCWTNCTSGEEDLDSFLLRRVRGLREGSLDCERLPLSLP